MSNDDDRRRGTRDDGRLAWSGWSRSALVGDDGGLRPDYARDLLALEVRRFRVLADLHNGRDAAVGLVTLPGGRRRV